MTDSRRCLWNLAGTFLAGALILWALTRLAGRHAWDEPAGKRTEVGGCQILWCRGHGVPAEEAD